MADTSEQRQGSAEHGPRCGAAGAQGTASRALVQEGEVSRTVTSPRQRVKATGLRIGLIGSHPRLQSATAEATFRKSHERQVQTGEVHSARRQNGPLGGRGRGPGLSQRCR